MNKWLGRAVAFSVVAFAPVAEADLGPMPLPDGATEVGVAASDVVLPRAKPRGVYTKQAALPPAKETLGVPHGLLHAPASRSTLERLRRDQYGQKCILHGAVTEVGTEDDLGVHLYFQTVLNRMESGRYGGHTACGVVHAVSWSKRCKCWVRQFTGVRVAAGRWHPRPSRTLTRMKALLNKYMSGEVKIPAVFASTRYYLNPCYADSGPLRDFRTTLRPLARHGHHSFFGEGAPNLHLAHELLDVGCPARTRIARKPGRAPQTPQSPLAAVAAWFARAAGAI